MATLDDNVILVEILPKLPTKSLIRFKCVSKSFNSAISSPELIDLHLRHHRISSSDHHLILPGLSSIECYDMNPSLSRSTGTSTFTWSDSSYVSVVGSTNGLLCVIVRYVHNSEYHACILNPTTRMHRDIRIPFPGVRVYNIGFGFEFDPQTVDHKIVLITNHTHDETLITMVFSLKNNSWNIIQTPQLPGDLVFRYNYTSGILINNNLLHWILWNPDTRISRIVCFNVSENYWTNDVLLPDIPYNDPTHGIHYPYEIGVLNGRLVTCIKNENNHEGLYEVWVMEEYGVQHSWFSVEIRRSCLGVLVVRGFLIEV
ncbi:hypothetical protein RND81_06G209100 [Saponaria officinalis]|uniref:F-box domain-containing protein n=1 Tax=Saponaria officinalis TaxID=3572 RepID=A0AAW1KDP4_SAPOF